MQKTADGELQKMVNAKVVNYYNLTQEDYNKYYITEHLGMHFGYWDNTVKSHGESLAKMNEVCANTAKIRKTDLVLDAGCGVGGSSIWIAKNTGARVIGITLVQKQLEYANKFTNEKGVEHLAHFKIMDFTNTEFDDETFDIVWALESSCYANDKRAFIAESYRILKKGGRLMVADGFLKKDPDKLTEPERSAMEEWTAGWAVPNLASIEEFRKYLVDLGFEDVKFNDITENVMPTSKLISSLGRKRLWLWRCLFSWWWLPTAKLINSLESKEGSQLNLLFDSKMQLVDSRAMITQLKCLEDGTWGYVIFSAKKR
ncbi:MAG: methyltransferase domain-containing protein [Nitrososphaera sp.]